MVLGHSRRNNIKIKWKSPLCGLLSFAENEEGEEHIAIYCCVRIEDGNNNGWAENMEFWKISAHCKTLNKKTLKYINSPLCF